MGVPAADVCKRDFKADIRFDQSRDLAHTLAEFTVWIARAVRWHVGLLLDRLHEFHGFECLAASALERCIRSRAVNTVNESEPMESCTWNSLTVFTATALLRPRNARGSDGPSDI